jgi:hypothetical protein
LCIVLFVNHFFFSSSGGILKNIITNTNTFTYTSAAHNSSADLNVDNRKKKDDNNNNNNNNNNNSNNSTPGLPPGLLELASAGVNLISVDYTQQPALRLDKTPDIFITPSVLRHFIRVCYFLK